MKKLIKSFFSVLTALCLIIPVFTFNVSAASVSVSGAGQYEVGRTFNVKVSFNADATLYAVEADISYNSSVLKLNSVSGADYTVSNGSIKIVDDSFSATKPSKSSSYTLNFTAIAAGNSNISATLLGGGEASSKASGSAAISVITPKPSSNANLGSINVSGVALSPAFSANTTSYTATVKYSVESVNISASVADGGATYVGGGTFALKVGENIRTLTVTAADGSKKSYTINIKRMTEEETANAEMAEREANPLLVVLDGVDMFIENDLSRLAIPAGFELANAVRKDSEVAVMKETNGKYELYWLSDANGENGAFYTRDENDVFSKLFYINANGKMYIIEELEQFDNLPETFAETKCLLDIGEADAIGYKDEGLKDFYIFNCYVDGENSYYRYDSTEGTMQRAVDFDLAISYALSSAESVDGPAYKNKIIKWFKNLKPNAIMIVAITAFVGILLITVLVLLIVKAVSGKKEVLKETPEQNEDFSLNDFLVEDTDDSSDE